MEFIIFFIVCILAYLLGSVNTSLLVSKVYGSDIRKHGSGSAGATNTLRTFGKQAALYVLIGDVLKGIIAVWFAGMIVGICANLTGNAVVGANFNVYRYAAGFCAILGHNFPIYFHFQGGKGILTTAAVVGICMPILFLWLLGAFIITVVISKMVSVGSIISSLGLMIVPLIFMRDNIPFIIFALTTGSLAIFMHRGNIARLLNGTENKLGAKKHKEG